MQVFCPDLSSEFGQALNSWSFEHPSAQKLLMICLIQSLMSSPWEPEEEDVAELPICEGRRAENFPCVGLNSSFPLASCWFKKQLQVFWKAENEDVIVGYGIELQGQSAPDRIKTKPENNSMNESFSLKTKKVFFFMEQFLYDLIPNNR